MQHYTHAHALGRGPHIIFFLSPLRLITNLECFDLTFTGLFFGAVYFLCGIRFSRSIVKYLILFLNNINTNMQSYCEVTNMKSGP